MLKSGENPLKSQDNEKWKGNMKTKIFSNWNFISYYILKISYVFAYSLIAIITF